MRVCCSGLSDCRFVVWEEVIQAPMVAMLAIAKAVQRFFYAVCTFGVLHGALLLPIGIAHKLSGQL